MSGWKPVLFMTLAFWSAISRAEEAIPLLPGGVVFPEYNNEGLGNPGTLSKDDARLFRALVAPDIFGSSAQELNLDYTFTQPNWGLDAGYDGSRTQSSSPTLHVVHAAAGYRLDSLGIGVAYRQPLTSGATTTATGNPAASDLELGLAYTMGRSRFGLVLDGLTASPAVTIGFGVRDEGTYSIELNLGLPPFSGFGGAGSVYTLTLASALYLKSFGLGYVTSFQMAGGQGTGFFSTPLTLTYGLTLLYKLTNTGSLSLRFEPGNVTILGVTFKI